MAKEYVIRIENATSESSAAPVAVSREQEQIGQPKSAKKPLAATYIASRALLPAVKSVAAYATSSVEISTGSRELQQKTERLLSIVGTMSGTASTVIGTTALFGSAGIGVGLAISAVNLATQYGIKQAQIQQQMRLEEEQLNLYRSRFGFGFNQSRTGGAT